MDRRRCARALDKPATHQIGHRKFCFTKGHLRNTMMWRDSFHYNLVMHKRDNADELRCSFCGDRESCARLISSPADHHDRSYICHRCVVRCSQPSADLPEVFGSRGDSGRECSFCRTQEYKRVSSPEALICEACLAVCRSMIESDEENGDGGWTFYPS
jgi:hypothetical protein